MNAALDRRELFSDAPQDEAWLRLLFNAAGLDPIFTIRQTDGSYFRSCVDDNGGRYCEQLKDGFITRIGCS